MTPEQFIEYYMSPTLWHPWFAWRPVKLKDGRWAWRRTIMRRYGPICGDGITRLPEYAEPFHIALGMYDK